MGPHEKIGGALFVDLDVLDKIIDQGRGNNQRPLFIHKEEGKDGPDYRLKPRWVLRCFAVFQSIVKLITFYYETIMEKRIAKNIIQI